MIKKEWDFTVSTSSTVAIPCNDDEKNKLLKEILIYY